MRIVIDENDNPFIACKPCGKKLNLFETVYYQGNYCIDCTRRREKK